MNIIKPNWDIFKAKFSENPQNNFEWLCYVLFCKEFEQDKGIFRFKNQSAIETAPIKYGEEFVGWQAKFYDTTLSQNKNKILKTLEEVKRNYPQVTKLLFYTNQEWKQYKGKPPQGLIDINDKAKELGIILEWKSKSYFESPFVSIENERIAKHFFTNDESFFDLVEELVSHTENVLTDIQTGIVFSGNCIEIERKKELDEIKESTQKIIVLSGEGGVGKTALVKKLYEEVKKTTPFYLFKATEFESRNINGFFKNYNFQDFVNAHNDDRHKIVVIDSAEKLLDLGNTDQFKEFLSILIKDNWKIIFTTRNNYVDVLNTEFFEIYNIVPVNILLRDLGKEKLQDLSVKYSFQLPKDNKLLGLIENPFYLSEYLKYYNTTEELDYKGFKNKIWRKNIAKNNPSRSDCFQKIVLSMANKGSFFVKSNCESSILNELIRDGVLGYEDDKGYFITHDIYEDWALEKIISKEFTQKDDNQNFFNEIGQSLAIRRGFRNWISEQLLLENNEVRNFIEEVIVDDLVDQSWKNEILVSILLSDYSDYFFKNFKELLLANNQELLKESTFWLRIACKEVDDGFLKQFDIEDIDLSILEHVLIKPKGNGWKSVIKFVFDNLEVIGIENIYFILPVIHDWNRKSKKGKTTRFSSLIALQYYQWIIEKGACFSHDDDTKEKLFQTIFYGSFEIKDELKGVFEAILKNKWKNHRDPYFDLSKTILTKLEGISISQSLPEYVMRLADLFWTCTPEKEKSDLGSRTEIGQYFQMEDDRLEYFPASSYKTPIYWLLESAHKETIDFILQFTNKVVGAFAKSEFAKYEVEEVKVFIDEKTVIKQYISNRLWCTYRGTQVSPHALESIHMALEKFFLEIGEKVKPRTLEYWLMYLLKNSKSASISAVVASIVLAFPDRTFNVAKVLFQTKKFFFYETSRWILDQTQKSQLLMLKNNFGVNPKNEIYENERLEACDDKHRKYHLENLFLKYQIFRNKKTTKGQAKKWQKELWIILDHYYEMLPKESEQTKADEIWRLYLARMDRRKMKLELEKKDDQTLIVLNPKIDPKLKQKSEGSLKRDSITMQYTALKMWAHERMENKEEYKKYDKYEGDPRLALKEVKEIILKLKAINKDKHLQFKCTEDESFYLLNHSIPGKVCAVLVRNFLDKLSQEEVKICKEVILEIASSSLNPNYQYQISDGVQSVISVLPILLEQFPREKNYIKTILLLTLFDDSPIGINGGKFNHYSVNTILKLWKDNFQDAQSLLFGYLLLKPKYEELRKKLREENYSKGIYELHEFQIANKFLDENKNALQKVLMNKISSKDCSNIKRIELPFLRTAFQLIPLKTEDGDHKKIVKEIISAFAEKLSSDDRDDQIDYTTRYDFLKKMAYFVLSSKKEEIGDYLKPFIDNFNNSEILSDLFREFILAEDYLDTYDNFWVVWNLFKMKVIEVCKDGDGYWYTDKMVKSYLFATVLWKEATVSWHTLKNEDKGFFKDISQKIGYCQSVLYSISKLLTDIGSSYLDDGILWISKMVKDNNGLCTAKLEVNTIYYLEKNVRKYIYKNREIIRKTKKTKEDVLIILDFLIERGSVVGYLLRENIL